MINSNFMLTISYQLNRRVKMSDWKNKTDFEINKAVALLVGLSVDSEQHCPHGRDGVVLCHDECGISVAIDYCDNPFDAWPIIIENNISIRLRRGMFKNENYCNPIARSGNVWCSDKNALRAAMIVFLKLKGVKP